MKIMYTTMSLVITGVLASCSLSDKRDMHDYQPSKKNSGEVVHAQLVALFDDHFSNINSAIPENEGFKIAVKHEDLTSVGYDELEKPLKVAFEIVQTGSKSHMFESGQYMINTKMGKAYVLAIASIAERTEEEFGEKFDLLYLTDFIGSTDSLKMSGRSKYGGEFGKITISRDDILIDGDNPVKDIVINPGDVIVSNQMLGILRAHSMRWHFVNDNGGRNISHLLDHNKYLIKSGNVTGPDLRYAEVQIRIKARSKTGYSTIYN